MRNDEPGETLGTRLARGRVAAMVGRDAERARLRDLLAPGGPAIAWLHGGHGIGKSTLLAAFEADAAAVGRRVLRLRGGLVEPSPTALLAALADAAGADAAGLADPPTVVTIDDAEELRLAWSWLRRELVPGLPATARLVIASALPPPPAWAVDFGSLFAAVALGPLPDAAIEGAARAAGLSDADARAARDVAAGYPLALALAIGCARAGRRPADATAGLAAAALEASGETRAIVEAAALVRRATRPILAAMLGPGPAEAFDRFAALPFVRRDHEGFALAEPVSRAIAERIRAEEPERYTALREAAVGWITGRLAAAGPAERWRHMADLLWLVEHRQIREAFFPGEAPLPAVEPFEPADLAAVLALAEAAGGRSERAVAAAWAEMLPHRLNVARDAAGATIGFYSQADGDDPLAPLERVDPLLAHWRTHRAARRHSGGVLFVRQMYGMPGEAGDLAVSACLLDVKRAYLARWTLGRVYAVATREALANPAFRRIGFRPLPPGVRPPSLVLDLPGGNVATWIAGLVGATPARADLAPTGFDREGREIVAGGAVVRLTRLEAAVLAELVDRAPAPVSRDTLIETAWRRQVVGSNVVDAVVRTLRRKLAADAARIETVQGLGYRWR